MRQGKGNTDPNDLVPGTNGGMFKNIRCFRCNHFGHYADRCGVVLMQTPISSNVSDVCNDLNEEASEGSIGFSFCQVNLNFAQINSISGSRFESTRRDVCLKESHPLPQRINRAICIVVGG